jgi:hypothetical protein
VPSPISHRVFAGLEDCRSQGENTVECASSRRARSIYLCMRTSRTAMRISFYVSCWLIGRFGIVPVENPGQGAILFTDIGIVPQSALSVCVGYF